jgi:hypothetical protein
LALIIYSINLLKTARKTCQPEMLYTNANQVIYGANSSFDDDVKYDSDSVEDTHIRIEHRVVQQRQSLPSN